MAFFDGTPILEELAKQFGKRPAPPVNPSMSPVTQAAMAPPTPPGPPMGAPVAPGTPTSAGASAVLDARGGLNVNPRPVFDPAAAAGGAGGGAPPPVAGNPAAAAAAEAGPGLFRSVLGAGGRFLGGAATGLGAGVLAEGLGTGIGNMIGGMTGMGAGPRAEAYSAAGAPHLAQVDADPNMSGPAKAAEHFKQYMGERPRVVADMFQGAADRYATPAGQFLSQLLGGGTTTTPATHAGAADKAPDPNVLQPPGKSGPMIHVDDLPNISFGQLAMLAPFFQKQLPIEQAIKGQLVSIAADQYKTELAAAGNDPAKQAAAKANYQTRMNNLTAPTGVVQNNLGIGQRNYPYGG